MASVLSCDTGRIFIGNVNESTPELFSYNGVYVSQPSSAINGKPVYKHESREHFIYFVPSSQYAMAQWVAGHVPGGKRFFLSTVTSDVTSQRWRLWLNDRQTWSDANVIRSVCVTSTFASCTSGELVVTTRNDRYKKTRGVGIYSITSDVQELRPVYKHVQSNDFLFYRSGMWTVGPNVSRASGIMFVIDNAWRPEFIVQDWVMYKGAYMTQDKYIRVICKREYYVIYIHYL